MTDLMLKTLQHHVNEKEEPSDHTRILILEHQSRITATMLDNMAKLIAELTESLNFIAEETQDALARMDSTIKMLEKRLESLEQWRAGANKLSE